MDAAVDVAFGGEVDHGARPVPGEERVEQRPVEDVALDEAVAGVAVERGQVLAVARVGEGVEVDHRLAGAAIQSRTKFEPMKPAPPVTRTVGEEVMLAMITRAHALAARGTPRR